MENIIYIVLSSAAVSGIVTLLTGQYFEHKRFLQKRKLEIYLSLIEEGDKLFDSSHNEKGITSEEKRKRMLSSSSKVHLLNRKVRLLTKNSTIRNKSHELVTLWDMFLNEDFVLEITQDLSQGVKHIEKINECREDFIAAANREINAWF
jgi:hypothetical protein